MGGFPLGKHVNVTTRNPPKPAAKSAALAVIPVTALSTDLASKVQSAQAYALGRKSPKTRLEYAKDFRSFREWCEDNSPADAEISSMPATPATVAVYLAHLADTGSKVSTIERRLAGIRYEHKIRGFPHVLKGSDAIDGVIEGIRRKLGVAVTKKRPFMDVALVVSKLPNTLIGIRDRAILTLGFICAFRRSELIALDVSDLHDDPEGYRVHMRRSKTDQEGRGFWKPVPRAKDPATCPVAAVQAWLSRAGPDGGPLLEGPLFQRVRRGEHATGERLTGHTIAVIVKQATARAGIDPSDFSSHSLRAGFVTSAAKAGNSIETIMRQTGHTDPKSVIGYIRFENLFDKSAAKDLL